MKVNARFRCESEACKTNPKREWSGAIEIYQVGLHAIWFHANHEGHEFSYWEDGTLVLGQGDMPRGQSVV